MKEVCSIAVKKLPKNQVSDLFCRRGVTGDEKNRNHSLDNVLVEECTVGVGEGVGEGAVTDSPD